VLPATVLFTTMTWGAGAVPSTTVSRYSLVGVTLKVGALAAYTLGSRSTATQRNRAWALIRNLIRDNVDELYIHREKYIL
jgi:hypothetical protein